MKGSVRKRGEKWSYYFSYKQDGTYKKKEKGGFRTKKEAETALRDVLQLYEKQSFIHNHQSYTVEEFYYYWKENVGINHLRHNTLQLYQQYFDKHIKNELGSVPIDKISPTNLQKYFSNKQKELGKSAIRTLRNVWSAVFKLAQKQNIIAINPLKQIEVSFQRAEHKVTSINRDVMLSFMEYIRDTDYYLPFYIATQTGLRRGEVLGLTWDNIDFENKKLTVNKALVKLKKSDLKLMETKTSSSKRTILMTQSLVDILKEAKAIKGEKRKHYGEYYYSGEDFVCSREDGYPIRPDSLSNQILRLSESFGANITFHMTRHTHATNLLESDINIKVIQNRLGHSNIATTLDIYSHVTEQMEEESIAKFEEKFKI